MMLHTMWRLLPLAFLFLSCSLGPGNFESRHFADAGARNIKRIAIFPLDAFFGEEKTSVPYSPAVFADGRGREKTAASVVSHHLYNAMSGLSNWQIVSDREVKEVEPLVPQGSPEARVRRLGQLVYADAVISGRILRYREREGEALGAQNPASVAFVLELRDVKRGDLIWSARFDETQKPLSENLFALGDFTQRGWRWLTAEELALEGVKKAVQQLHEALYRRPT